jgi:hypothetical protein
MSKPLDPPHKPTKHGPHVGKDQAPLICPINGLHLVYRYTIHAFHQEQLSREIFSGFFMCFIQHCTSSAAPQISMCRRMLGSTPVVL